MMNLTTENVRDMRKAFQAAVEDKYGTEEKREFYINERAFRMHRGCGTSEHLLWITDLEEGLDVAMIHSIMSWETVFLMAVVAMNEKVTKF